MMIKKKSDYSLHILYTEIAFKNLGITCYFYKISCYLTKLILFYIIKIIVSSFCVSIQ